MIFVREVIVLGSFVQFSFFYQVSNAGGFFDQVDGPVLVNVAGVVTVAILFNNVIITKDFVICYQTVAFYFYNFTVGSFLSFERVGCYNQFNARSNCVVTVNKSFYRQCSSVRFIIFCINACN